MTRVVRRAWPRRGDSDAVVRLRLVTNDGAKRMLARDPAPGDRWAEGYPGDGDLEAATAMLRLVALGTPPSAFGPYEILTSEESLVIGGIGFHAPPDALGSVEIGYGVVESQRNNGYATAALKVLIGMCFQLGVRRVEARADPANVASRRVLEKAGMAAESMSNGLVTYRLSLY